MIKHYVDFMTNNITEKKPIPYVNKGRTITLDIEYCSERPYRYLNPTVIKLCNKTELEVIYYIEEHLKKDNYSKDEAKEFLINKKEELANKNPNNKKKKNKNK